MAATQSASGAPPGPAGAGGRFHHATPQKVTGKYVKALSNNPVTVMVQLSGDPVTVAQAKAQDAGRTLTPAQKAAIRSDLRSRQATVEKQVQADGGKVRASYQAAYNGVRVTVPARSVPKLSTIPGVVGVHAITPKKADNVHGVPLIGAPQVWGGLSNLHGEGIKIGIIDTGIDYTHADFGGPGTVAAYQNALAHDTQPADPALFGPNAPRVKGGTDLVGDDYNADPTSDDYQPIPHPDSNPLDCAGHGSHVAGTAAGSGVLSDGTTYTGPYNATTISSHTWNVGPGVAPKANLYAIRVFGCAGSTDVVVDAIEWAVNNGMNVINMSLGAPNGGPDDPDVVATDNAAAAGVIVATSSGNEGSNPYMSGSPGTANGAISSAALDPTASFPAATIALPGGVNLTAIDANGIPVNGLSAPIKVLYTGTPHDAAHISLGCDPAEYTAANVTGAIVVVKRGTCARVARAIFGQQAGAAAVVMVNSTNDFPPYEGPITENPDDGTPYTVTIPFLGVRMSDGPALVAADGATATLTDTTLANPGYLSFASFSSFGPRSGDSAQKPDVTAPGVSIASAGMGTGNQFAVLSGTSMASPHTAGAEALVRQAHPDWLFTTYWRGALENTADASQVANYSTRGGGTGLIQVQRAVATNVVATGDSGTASLSYGFRDLGADFSQAKKVKIRNFGRTAVTFTVGHARDSGLPHSVTLPSTVTVPARSTVYIAVQLNVPAATAADATAFGDVAGLLTLTPQGGGNGGISLSMPYYMVPHAVSRVHTTGLHVSQLKKFGTTNVAVTNIGGVIAGNADWYAWGTSDPDEAGIGSNDIRAVGAQSFPGDGVFAFALSTYSRWSNAAQNEYDIYVDVNGDDDPDYVVVAADFGLVTAGDNNGQVGVFVFDLKSGDGSIEFFADAPTDSTTMVLPVLFDQLCATDSPCLSESNPRITYSAVGLGRDGTTDNPSEEATFNVFNPSVSTGMFDTVAPNTFVGETVTYDAAEFAESPAKGFMVISHDNPASSETQLIAI